MSDRWTSFPLSDHHIRGFSIIGEPDKCLDLFKQLYTNNPSGFIWEVLVICYLLLLVVSIFLRFISTLVAHFDSLAQSSVSVDLSERLPQNRGE